MDAPTQSGSVAVRVSPNAKFASNIGYRINSVNGSRFYNDPRDVAGSLVSTYQSPFVNVAWTVHPGFIWKAEYNFYGYGEGGPSGAAYCSTTNPTPGGTGDGCPLQFPPANRHDDFARGGNRTAQLPRQQHHPRISLRILRPEP